MWSAPSLISLRRAPVGFADWTAATPITGAPAAYCSDIDTLRASRTEWLSAPEHHRYVRVLDRKYHAGRKKRLSVEPSIACKHRQIFRLKLFSKVERLAE